MQLDLLKAENAKVILVTDVTEIKRMEILKMILLLCYA